MKDRSHQFRERLPSSAVSRYFYFLAEKGKKEENFVKASYLAIRKKPIRRLESDSMDQRFYAKICPTYKLDLPIKLLVPVRQCWIQRRPTDPFTI